MVILQCAVIFAFLALGELVVWLTGVSIPSSIIGMLIIKLRHVEGAAEFLIKNLGFFFIPAGVALVGYFDVLRAQWLPIVAASVVSTVIVLGITGQLHQMSRKIFNRHAVSRK